MNKGIKTASLKTINNNNYDKSINKLIKKIEINQKKCKYMSGQLCKLLKEVKEDFITLQTPFDIVYIKLKKNKKSETEETEVEETELKETEVSAGSWSSYVNLSDAIEKLIPNKVKRADGLEKIYKYLSILKDENIKTIKQFNDKVKYEFNVKNNNQYNVDGKNIRQKGTVKEEYKRKQNLSLAYLSAILMISEPFRFNDGGGLSRGAIRYIYINLKSNNDDNAISNALGGEIDDDKLLFSTEGGKSAVNNIIKKHQNSKKDKNNNVDENDDNLKNMKLEYVSDDEDDEDNNKKEYSLRSKGISEKEKKEIIIKAYQKGDITFFQAVGEIHELKNKSPKKSKIITKKNKKEEEELKEGRITSHLKSRKQKIDNIIREKRGISPKKFREDI